MEEFETGEPFWIIQPLIDAGLRLNQIRELMFTLTFECMTGDGHRTVSDVEALVGPKPAGVRAAWHTSIGRMIVP